MTVKSKRIDYAKYAKRGMILGLGMFVLGGIGEVVGRTVFGELPGWENLLLTDMIGLGVSLTFVSFFVVG
ncbi:MAG: hypothetical protein SXQ77_00165, partial [Halobacteria archaeon]|nr:hypothetical protein [Halobacteria archaeon]